MATADYDRWDIVTPPPGKTPSGPGVSPDLPQITPGNGGTVSGGDSGSSAGGAYTHTDLYTGLPDFGAFDLGPVTYGPNTVAVPEPKGSGISIPDVTPPDIKVDYSRIPEFDLPDVKDAYKTQAVPEITLQSKQDLIPGGDTQLLTKDTPGYDWEAIAANAPKVTAEQTVKGQLENLFSNPDLDPLWQHAAGLGKMYANSRGLINSSIANQAASEAIYAAALPMAQQDANTYAARAQQEAGFWQAAGLQAQQATIASALQAQGHLENMREMALQGDINAQLQLEQFGYNWRLNEQENIHRMAQQAWQGKIDAKLNLQKLGIDAEKMRIDTGYRVFMQTQEARNALKLQNNQHANQLEQMAWQQKYTLDAIDQESARRIDQINQQGRIDMERDRRAAGYREAEDYRRADIEARDREDRHAWDEADREDRQAWDEAENERQRQHERDIEDERRAEEERQKEEERKWAHQQNYLTATGNRTAQFSDQANAVWSQPGLTPEQQRHAVDVLWRNYLADMDFLYRQYSSSPYWDESWKFEPIGKPDNPTTPPDTHTVPPPGTPGNPGDTHSTPPAGTPNDPDYYYNRNRDFGADAMGPTGSTSLYNTTNIDRYMRNYR